VESTSNPMEMEVSTNSKERETDQMPNGLPIHGLDSMLLNVMYENYKLRQKLEHKKKRLRFFYYCMLAIIAGGTGTMIWLIPRLWE
jgi:hypothetical protein